MKRAGLDYWPRVDVVQHADLDAFIADALPTFDEAVFFSKHAKYGATALFDHEFRRPAPGGSLALMFGSETEGIDFVPDDVIEAHERLFLPMSDGIRSYNLACSAAVGVMEAVRQRPEFFRPDLAKQ